MSKKVYTLTREIATEHGVTRIPVKTFDNPEAANEFGRDTGSAISELLESRLMRQVDAARAADTGLSLKEFLASIGISNIRHTVVVADVHSSNLARPKTGIILSS